MCVCPSDRPSVHAFVPSTVHPWVRLSIRPCARPSARPPVRSLDRSSTWASLHPIIWTRTKGFSTLKHNNNNKHEHFWNHPSFKRWVGWKACSHHKGTLLIKTTFWWITPAKPQPVGQWMPSYFNIRCQQESLKLPYWESTSKFLQPSLQKDGEVVPMTILGNLSVILLHLLRITWIDNWHRCE